MTRPLRRARVALALMGALAASGCLGRSPTTRFYTLEPLGGAQVLSEPADVAVSVGPVEVPRYLDRPQIVSRDGSNEVVVDQFRRWAGGLEGNVSRVLASNLAQRLGSSRVVAHPTEAPFPVDYSVVLDFDELVAVQGVEVLLRARWVVRDRDRQAQAVEQSSVRRPLPRKSIEGTIRAHEEVLAALSDEIAGRIAELVRAARDAPPPAAPDAAEAAPPT